MDNPLSPNEIPLRMSSVGCFNSSSKPSKPVLRPLSEDNWLGNGKKSNSTLSLEKTPTPVILEAPTKSPLAPPTDTAQRDERNHEAPKTNGTHIVSPQTTQWSEEKEKILFGPYDYMYGHPGKDIRAQLIAAFNAWLKVPKESLEIITKVVGMLHTASLLVDDVEDSSVLRRGVPVAHSIFGTAQTINSANYVYFCALRELQKLQSPKAIEIYTEELLNLHRGQGMDLFWRDTLTCPSEDDYLEMVSNKTGGLFRLAVKLMQAESSSNKNCIPLVSTIGLLFQILDDYLNLLSPIHTHNKGLAEDLTEGKFSFPILHAVRADPSNRVLVNILKQKTADDEVKRYAIGYMERMGSFEYTRGVLEGLTSRALGEVDVLEEGGEDGEREGQGGEGERQGKGVGRERVRDILERMRVERPESEQAVTQSSTSTNGLG